MQLVLIAIEHTVESLQQHGVAREDGLIGIPLLMDGSMTTPHIGIIHQVVVQQGKVVIGLETNGRHHDALRIVAIEIVGEQHQHRAHALAS